MISENNVFELKYRNYNYDILTSPHEKWPHLTNT